MSFTQDLRQFTAPLFEAVYHHPFIQGIAQGHLNKEQLVHYVKQDHEYLKVYSQVFGLAISKSDSIEDMAAFNEKIYYSLHGEAEAHENLCQVAGVSYDELHGGKLSPTAHHYTRHMLSVAERGTLGEIMAVMLPCPWIYIETGVRLYKEVQPEEGHPFNKWITFYGNNPSFDDVLKQLCDRLDVMAEQALDAEKLRMKEHFLISCQLEYQFFDMAYTLEEWPVNLQG